MKKVIISCFAVFMFVAIQAQDLTGNWYGLLDGGKSQIPVVFHITEEGKKEFSSTMDSPTQGAMGIPMDETEIKGCDVKVAFKAMQMTYEGKYNKKKNIIEGVFSQGGRNTEMNLSREEQERKVNRRKQEPTDFPYEVEEVRITNAEAEVVIAGTLTKPKGTFDKAVILISGSGAQDRNSDLGSLNHRPFLVWSDYLTRNGIAVMRYDDRGTAKSTGDYQTATSADLSTDTEAVLEYLKMREDMEGVKIGLMGHSEGGMIAPMVAARNEKVDFTVLLAGPAIPIIDLLLKQKYDLMKAAFIPQEMIDNDQECARKAFEFIGKHNETLPVDELETQLYEIVLENVKTYAPIMKGGKADEDVAKAELEQYMATWFRYFISYDPTENLSKTTCPVLAINGTLDLQVSNDANLEAIEEIMKENGNTNFKIQSYKNLNHLFQAAKTGTVAEYGAIEETINEKVLEDVKNWITELKF